MNCWVCGSRELRRVTRDGYGVCRNPACVLRNAQAEAGLYAARRRTRLEWQGAHG